MPHSPCILLAACLIAIASPARADDIFIQVPLPQMKFTNGSLPVPEPAMRSWRLAESLSPCVVLDGPGEAFLTDGSATEFGWRMQRFEGERAILVAKLPTAGPISGTLYVPDAKWRQLTALKFELTPAAGGSAKVFYHAKAEYYEHLQSMGAPGAALFRREADLAHRATGDDAQALAERWRPGTVVDLDTTYELFTGGQALSENLQLDRQLQQGRPAGPEDVLVDTSTIDGITVAAYDWTKRLAGLAPALDPLASAIPADQHVIFFPSFQSLMEALDTVGEQGLPLYRGVLGSTEDGMLSQRYQRQLCLPRTILSRLLGPGVVQSVAITGGDLYFPTGTDIAVVFQASNPEALRAVLAAQITLAQSMPGVAARSGEIAGVKYQGSVSDDRAVCAYVGTCGGSVVVTNSLEQLRRLAAVKAGTAPAIATLEEYRFFRSRYALGEAGETALVFISDPAIRRWCGPRSRISASRRLRALAIMSDVTAAHMGELVAGLGSPVTVQADMPMRTIGELTLTPTGVRSSVYGGMGFLTPISELEAGSVTSDEAAAYQRWRDSYQRNWSWAFDPIAIRLGLEKGRVSADLSVMPLIMSTQYRSWATLAQGVTIAPDAGDPHDAILHGIFAINTQSGPAQQAAGFATMMAQGVQIDPLGWMGRSVAVYADADPFWERMLKSEDIGAMFDAEGIHMPVALHAEVSSALKLTAFLASVRAWIEQSAPGMAAWETRTYKDQAYVCVGLSEKAKAESRGGGFDRSQLFYAATPRALVVSLNEDVLKRAIDRQAERAKAPAGQAGQQAGEQAGQTGPWLGQTFAAHVRPEGVSLFHSLDGSNAQESAQRAAWLNLPILNEWKRRFPDKDPVEVHRTLWGSRLVSPGGGTYAWDDGLKMMVSTLYGSPAAPRKGPDAVDLSSAFRAGDFGVTLEEQGLRARVVVDRPGK